MLKVIALSTLLITSMSASAAVLKLTDTNSGIYVQANEQSQPVSGLTVKVTNVPQLNDASFTTDEHGRVFIPLSLNASRSVRVEASDMESNTIFHRSGR
ncbi:hypothetical protein L4C36_10395 [Photobacterium japonica]|uniref:hypothetical protein n=1 Tax=Photobacterium japonica TaxID=2910235 RepID=UPI003D102793